MLTALCLAAGLSTCVPARWPSGDPKSLELLNGAAINTLLLERANWNAAFIEGAARSGIVSLGVIHPGDDYRELARTAARLKFNGLVLDGDFPDEAIDQASKTGLSIIGLTNRGRIPLDKRHAIVGTSQALWPGIEIEHGGKVSTGPSSAPWSAARSLRIRDRRNW